MVFWKSYYAILVLHSMRTRNIGFVIQQNSILADFRITHNCSEQRGASTCNVKSKHPVLILDISPSSTCSPMLLPVSLSPCLCTVCLDRSDLMIISGGRKVTLGREPPPSTIYSGPGPEAMEPPGRKNKVIDQPEGK